MTVRIIGDLGEGGPHLIETLRYITQRGGEDGRVLQECTRYGVLNVHLCELTGLFVDEVALGQDHEAVAKSEQREDGEVL